MEENEDKNTRKKKVQISGESVADSEQTKNEEIDKNYADDCDILDDWDDSNIDYEKKFEDNRKRNDVLLNEFFDWLTGAGLTDKTAKTHLNNVGFYVHNFLTYDWITPAEEGYLKIDDFLSYWFPRKAMWSTEYSVKSNITSLKKFYLFLTGKGLLNESDYIYLLDIIKRKKEYWIDNINRYNNEEDFY